MTDMRKEDWEIWVSNNEIFGKDSIQLFSVELTNALLSAADSESPLSCSIPKESLSLLERGDLSLIPPATIISGVGDRSRDLLRLLVS